MNAPPFCPDSRQRYISATIAGPSQSAPAQPEAGPRLVFVTVVLAVLGFGLLIPVLPELVKQFQGGSVVEGSHSYGWLVSSYALMQFIGSPILGSLSDRFGRRKVILIALAGSSIDFVVMAMAPSLTILFLARMVGGITAGVLSTANAYMADVTPPAQRAQAFGMIGAAFGLGFIIGPLIGGILGSVDIRLPFWVAAALSASTGLRFLRAARVARPENRRGFPGNANPVGALVALKRFPAVLGSPNRISS